MTLLLIFQIIKSALKQKETSIVETTLVSKNREQIPVRLSLSQLKTKDKQVMGIVGLFRDLRVEKQLEQQLFQAEKLAAIGKLGADIAHEVNNPLSIIKTSIRILFFNLTLHNSRDTSIKNS